MSALGKFIPVIPKDSFNQKELLKKIEEGIIPENALSWSAENGYYDLAEQLLKLGAKYNENRNYPLELASRNGHTEIVKLLIEAGANTIDSGEDEGYCLRLAANNGHDEIVKLLLNAGADPMADNYFALKLALNRHKMVIVEMLLDAIFQKRMIH